MKSSFAAIAAAAAMAAAVSLTAGCASLNSVTSEVSSFGEWPAGRAPGTYAFERLPSQQARQAETELLENAARPALEARSISVAGTSAPVARSAASR